MFCAFRYSICRQPKTRRTSLYQRTFCGAKTNWTLVPEFEDSHLHERSARFHHHGLPRRHESSPGTRETSASLPSACTWDSCNQHAATLITSSLRRHRLIIHTRKEAGKTELLWIKKHLVIQTRGKENETLKDVFLYMPVGSSSPSPRFPV
jgi:hypothetical protein